MHAALRARFRRPHLCADSSPDPLSSLLAAPRYYGTVFTIILTIILFGGVSIYLGYTCYHEFTSSPDRIAEMKALEQQLNREATEPADADKADPGSFGDRVKESLAKVSFRAVSVRVWRTGGPGKQWRSSPLSVHSSLLLLPPSPPLLPTGQGASPADQALASMSNGYWPVC